ncbi:non-homologous end joining protein Ku [Calidifontibacillus erzurumensis]|uniref:Non-homologous end joining protein Ku n=1 Tax=Calidifontibacillus erzurumensis TaxID=2741433 RepID=A0A8J8KCI7_9BACI|nr:Ku protein [Calidifontibacillus erzurumensis]NSL52657.1 Ku protein [Calidifontibacillus erzurumensis]
MQTIWKGTISFGLVNIPINLFAATENKDISFRSLHKECNSPIKYEKVCPVCDREVTNDEIIKGYEYEPGKFVVISSEELKEIAPESNRTIEIIDFVKLDEIDPIYFDKSYFLGPQENGLKSYYLLKQAMEQTGKIGLAKITIRSKESLAIVRVYQSALLLETIFFPDEVRNVEHVPGLEPKLKLDEKELNMAIQLIEQLTTQFEPEKYTNDYRSTLMELIESKVTGKEITVPKEWPKTNVVDLMAALQASIDQTRPLKQVENNEGKEMMKKKKKLSVRPKKDKLKEVR